MMWVTIGAGNGLAPVRRQAITPTNADLLSTGHQEEISVEIQ